MFTARPAQRELFSVTQEYADLVGKNSFYVFLGKYGHVFIRDSDFEDFYHPSNGRPAVPPSILMRTLLLQIYDRVSDEEATRRVRTDLAWKAALDIAVDEVPFTSKSTLVMFRAKLLASQRAREVFAKIVQKLQDGYNFAMKKRGPKGGKVGKRVALDTTPVFGRGAVKDVFNLLADEIKHLVILVATALRAKPSEWAREHGFGSYFGKSFKGMCRINWDDPRARDELLTRVVGDGQRICRLAKRILEEGKDRQLGEKDRQALESHLALLDEIVAQNVEAKPDGSQTVKQGVARDRILSTTDPEMRHGRKSHSQRFDGYKLGVAADVDTGLITDVEVLDGNAHDGQAAEALVEGTEQATGEKVEEILGDTAFGDTRSRLRWQERGVRVTAKAPRAPRGKVFSKDQFEVGPNLEWVRCPAGHLTHTWRKTKVKIGQEIYQTRQFRFPREQCMACPLAAQCLRNSKGGGRVVTLHPYEEVLRAARREQETEAFQSRYRRRVVVEHRIARLVQLGMRKARYFGKEKVLLQALLTAMVANLTLFWGARKAQMASSSLFLFVQRLHFAILVLATASILHRPHPTARPHPA